MDSNPPTSILPVVNEGKLLRLELLTSSFDHLNWLSSRALPVFWIPENLENSEYNLQPSSSSSNTGSLSQCLPIHTCSNNRCNSTFPSLHGIPSPKSSHCRPSFPNHRCLKSTSSSLYPHPPTSPCARCKYISIPYRSVSKSEISSKSNAQVLPSNLKVHKW